MIDPLVLVQVMMVYLYPLLLGRSLALMVRKGSHPREFMGGVLNIPGYAAVGTLVIFGLAMLIRFGLMKLVPVNFGAVFFPVSAMLITASIMINLAEGWKNRKKVTKTLQKVFWPIVLTVITAMVSYGIWTHKSPYPLNWDYNQHQQLVRLIRQGQFDYFASNLSDTFGFNSYPPIFHLLIALGQFPMALNPQYVVSFWQINGLIHLVTVGLSTYILAYTLSRHKWVGILAMIMGVLSFDGLVSMTSLFFLPQTLAAVLFAWFMAKILAAYDGEVRVLGGEWLAVMAVLMLMHYMVGGLAAAVILGTEGYRRISAAKPRWLPGLLVGGAIVGLTITVFLMSGNLNFAQINQGEAKEYVAAWGEKAEAVERTWGYLAYILIPLGMVYAVVQKKRSYRVSLLVLFGLVLVTLSQVPYAMKVMTLTRFLITTYMALGIYCLGQYIGNKVIRGLVVGLTVIVSMAILISGSLYWKTEIRFLGLDSHIGADDIAGAQALFQMMEGKRYLLISDPTTQFFLEGMSGADSIGGQYMKAENRQKLIAAWKNGQMSGLVGAAREMNDGIGGEVRGRFLAISGRTFAWLQKPEAEQMSFTHNLWAPIDLAADDYNIVHEVANQAGLVPIYQSKSLVIFQVN